MQHPPVAGPGPASVSAGSGAPTSATAFDADPRVHFDQRSGKWAFEADDGTELEWDVARGVWVPVLEESIVSQQQAAYSVEGVDESTPVAAVQAREAKKRKDATDDSSSSKKPKRAPKPPSAPRNTAIYVSRLPLSTTSAQIAAVFSKAGLILEDADGNPKIKMYKDEQGRFKGEALVVYLKAESVDLAVTLMDDTELELGSGQGNMVVKKAEWEKKPPGEGENDEAGEGKKQGKGVDVEKQRTARRAEKLLQKLTDWDSDEESSADIAARAKNNRIVVLEGMFTLKELEEDPTLLLDLKEDVREETEKLGEVTNVTLYDQEEAGIMTVRFKDDIAAQACIAKMNGRFFGGRSILAYVSEGTKKYKKSGQAVSLVGTGLGGSGDEREDDKEQDRLEKYAEWLESQK